MFSIPTRAMQCCSLAFPHCSNCPMVAEMLPRMLLDSKVCKETTVGDDAPSSPRWLHHRRYYHLKPMAHALLSPTYAGQRRPCPLPRPHWAHAVPTPSAKSCSSPAL